MFRDRRLTDLFGIELPILQAPMAGAQDVQLAIAVAEAGGLGALPCAMLTPATASDAVAEFRRRTDKPLNLNFFCHRAPDTGNADVQAGLDRWRARLKPLYDEFGIDPDVVSVSGARAPFDDAWCRLVEQVRPEVVSFHFGLPSDDLLARVRATGAKVISSATTVAEAVWLAARGVDAVIGTGAEAGGHRGSFLHLDMTRQVGTMALVPQIVDAVDVPVIAAGGIGDGRGVAAGLALGAAAVQIGTAYLFTEQARISDAHRDALAGVASDGTAITNLFTGRPARGIVNRLMRELGPMSEGVPPFPLAGGALTPLKGTPHGARDFTNLWAGQGAPLMQTSSLRDARILTRQLAADAEDVLAKLRT